MWPVVVGNSIVVIPPCACWRRRRSSTETFRMAALSNVHLIDGKAQQCTVLFSITWYRYWNFTNGILVHAVQLVKLFTINTFKPIKRCCCCYCKRLQLSVASVPLWSSSSTFWTSDFPVIFTLLLRTSATKRSVTAVSYGKRPLPNGFCTFFHDTLISDLLLFVARRWLCRVTRWVLARCMPFSTVAGWGGPHSALQTAFAVYDREDNKTHPA